MNFDLGLQLITLERLSDDVDASLLPNATTIMTSSDAASSILNDYGGETLDLAQQSGVNLHHVLSVLRMNREGLLPRITEVPILVDGDLVKTLIPHQSLIERETHGVMIADTQPDTLHTSLGFIDEETSIHHTWDDVWVRLVMVYLKRFDRFTLRTLSPGGTLERYLSPIDSRKVSWVRGVSPVHPTTWSDVMMMFEMVGPHVHPVYLPSIQHVIFDTFGVKVPSITAAVAMMKLFMIARTMITISGNELASPEHLTIDLLTMHNDVLAPPLPDGPLYDLIHEVLRSM